MIEYLYDALRSEYGVIIETSSPDKLRQKLYAIMREHKPEFENLALKVSPLSPTSELWIAKKRRDEDAETT